MSFPIPFDEDARLAALNELALLDTANEPVFDRITRLVSLLLNVPMAAVSLVDANRQWFKSKVGMDTIETPRDEAFCAYTVVQAVPLIVNDALLDERFADNPYVTMPGGVRFYAGLPLKSSQGYVLGSLCAMDIKPRTLNIAEQAAMKDLADIVVGEIQLRERLIDEQKSKVASQRALNALHLSLEQQIEQRIRELNLVIETACDAYISIDENGRVLDWNRAAETMFGWSRKEALTRSITTLMLPNGLPSDVLLPAMGEAKRRDGVRLPVEIRLKSYEVNGRTRRSLFIHDITERKQLERLRDQEAREDVLTRLPNRRALDERLPEAMARVRRTRKPLAVLFLDLDGFKNINDQYGHAMGDELLRDTAQRLQAAVRETDFVARWAGDEFVVLLEGIDCDAVGPLADKLIHTVEQPIVLSGAVLNVNTSIGVALFMPEAAETSQELLKRADVAMYEAKRAGKGQVRLAQPVDS
ncbi:MULTISPECIES: diguanylate cyclase [unclassified Halomonas]|uniref:diguanylate cyclase n=1 Tax=unclassified Halomonas TaxID=2609666 RepID=UPI0009905A77|nr:MULTISPECIES: diguanylate cyclase [unclassified Halomonas]AQU83197.1 sensor domain-containing diguanylate cyclase [Halomonas sp. 'Soap Lake \